MKILFTADWHINVGQKNVPETWACERYSRFFKEVHKLEKDVDLHVIGGDLFDRVPSMIELELYFEFISGVELRTLIYYWNHEARMSRDHRNVRVDVHYKRVWLPRAI